MAFEIPDYAELTGAAKNFADKATNSLKGGLQNRKGLENSTKTGTSTDPALTNRDYSVIITQEQNLGGNFDPRIVVGGVPASFQMTQDVAWKAPWGAGLAGDGQIADLLAVRGNRFVGQVMTMQVWQGSGNDFDFTVSFELRAYSNPDKDVMEPLRTLLRMSLPSLDSTGWLKSPGPILDEKGIEILGGKIVDVATQVLTITKATVQGALNNGYSSALETAKKGADDFAKSGIVKKETVSNLLKNKISISIGRWFHMDNVVITQVQHDIKSQTPNGDSGMIQAANVTIGFKPMFAVTANDVNNILLGGSLAPVSNASAASGQLTRGQLLDPNAYGDG